MDSQLQSYLSKHKINYMEHKHQAVFTVEEAKSIESKLPNILHTKNLFLKSEEQKFFLVCMYAYDRLDLKKLAQVLKTKKLSFSSAEQLKEKLNLTPGSVSIFGMIRATGVSLIIDQKIWFAEKVGFHPNINTATLELSHEDLEKFYNSLNCEKRVLNLENGS